MPRDGVARPEVPAKRGRHAEGAAIVLCAGVLLAPATAAARPQINSGLTTGAALTDLRESGPRGIL